MSMVLLPPMSLYIGCAVEGVGLTIRVWLCLRVLAGCRTNLMLEWYTHSLYRESLTSSQPQHTNVVSDLHIWVKSDRIHVHWSSPMLAYTQCTHVHILHYIQLKPSIVCRGCFSIPLSSLSNYILPISPVLMVAHFNLAGHIYNVGSCAIILAWIPRIIWELYCHLWHCD